MKSSCKADVNWILGREHLLILTLYYMGSLNNTGGRGEGGGGEDSPFFFTNKQYVKIKPMQNETNRWSIFLVKTKYW